MLQNATLVLGIEGGSGVWNNSLAGYYNCNNSNTAVSTGGDNATAEWNKIYLNDAVGRLNAMTTGFKWTHKDAWNAQSLCAYETVSFGYSAFCSLFTYEEWQGYEYSVDINFAGDDAFQSPTGRATGIGYVQEVLARLQGRLITEPTAQCNITLDSMPETFPLNQSLYFDFSHDSEYRACFFSIGC